jgi:hypothetical protein
MCARRLLWACLSALSWTYTSTSLIFLRSATFDTEHERLDERRRALFADDAGIQTGAPAIYLLHFEKVTTAARRAVLASSSLILGYVPHNTLLVSSEAPSSVLRAIQGVTWSMSLLPAHKIDPQLLEVLDETSADAAPRSVVVQVVDLIRPRAWPHGLQRQGCRCSTRSFGASTILLSCRTADHVRCACDWIARQPEAIWLEAKAEYAVLNKYAVPLVRHTTEANGMRPNSLDIESVRALSSRVGASPASHDTCRSVRLSCGKGNVGRRAPAPSSMQPDFKSCPESGTPRSDAPPSPSPICCSARVPQSRGPGFCPDLVP